MFALEVTHVRGLQRATSRGIDGRLIDVLAGKLSQMQVGIANVLLVTAPGGDAKIDLGAHAAWIKKKAESRDRDFYKRQRFLEPAEFFRYFQRLSALLLQINGAPTISWQNRAASVQLPGDLLRAFA
jgi:hypothetical protein